MANCSVRWRPSGGRGEFEFVPGTALVGKDITVAVDQFGVSIPAEVSGTISQEKPRLRKHEPNNRSKLHLVNLVMAIVRLPDPAREDKTRTVSWPLEKKGFIVSEMDFEILRDDGANVLLKPLTARILHSDQSIDLQTRLDSLRADMEELEQIQRGAPDLAEAIAAHWHAVQAGINSIKIRHAADEVIANQVAEFGDTNGAAISTIEHLPPTPLEEDIVGNEGRFFTRLHSSRERDRGFIRKAKKLFKSKNGGKLFCECCGFEPIEFYGSRGEDRIQAHHKTPVEELLPDTQTKPEDLAMVCPNCHDIIHAKRPWLDVEALYTMLQKSGNHYFKR
jgi:hypothetical protein